jgi:2-keto-3-deoxy-6-phosphogluconate aldolase
MSVIDIPGYLGQARVIPVLTPTSVASGLAISRILCKAGLRVQEITLRTPAALETLTAIRRDLPELIVGVGSVLTPELGRAAIGAGARFLVSPGTAVHEAVPHRGHRWESGIEVPGTSQRGGDRRVVDGACRINR